MEFYKSEKISDKWGIAFTKKEFRGKPTAVVYFLDLDYKFDNACGLPCQITTGSYYIEDVINHAGSKLCLDGGISKWTVAGDDLKVAKLLCEAEALRIKNAALPLKGVNI